MASAVAIDPSSRWVSGLLIVLLLSAALVVGVRGLREAGHYPDVRVEAAPYEWPSRCPQLAYGREEAVPKNCTRTRAYRLRDADKLGLVTMGRDSRWYRVGDDALRLDCATFSRFCKVKDRSIGKFVRVGYYDRIAKPRQSAAKQSGVSTTPAQDSPRTEAAEVGFQ